VMSTFMNGGCQAALVNLEDVQTEQNKNNFCGVHASSKPILPMAYGMPVSSRVARSLSMAIKSSLGDWLQEQKNARPLSTCIEPDSALQPITPWHCSGILMVTLALILVSFFIQMASCRKRIRDRNMAELRASQLRASEAEADAELNASREISEGSMGGWTSPEDRAERDRRAAELHVGPEKSVWDKMDGGSSNDTAMLKQAVSQIQRYLAYVESPQNGVPLATIRETPTIVAPAPRPPSQIVAPWQPPTEDQIPANDGTRKCWI